MNRAGWILAILLNLVSVRMFENGSITSPSGLSTNLEPRNQSQSRGYDKWFANNVRNDGGVGITNTCSRGASGSIEFDGSANAKANLEYYFHPSDAFNLSMFNGFSYDYFRSSSNTASPTQMPALRLYVSDGTQTGCLVYEAIYSDQPVSPAHRWTHADVFPPKIWGAGMLPDAFTDYSRTASDWSAVILNFENLRIQNRYLLGKRRGSRAPWTTSPISPRRRRSHGAFRRRRHRAVPEPETWAMTLLIGMGMMGVGTRFHRTRDFRLNRLHRLSKPRTPLPARRFAGLSKPASPVVTTRLDAGCNGFA